MMGPKPTVQRSNPPKPLAGQGDELCTSPNTQDTSGAVKLPTKNTRFRERSHIT